MKKPNDSRLMRAKPSLFFPLLCALSAVVSGMSQATTPKAPEVQQFEILPREVPPLAADLLGGFAAAGKEFLVVGGRDATDSTAVSIWSLPLESGGGAAWSKAEARIPLWSACAQSGDDILCAGGMVDGKPVDRVSKLVLAGGKVSVVEMPRLPKPLAGAGAAVVGTKLLVFGGLSATELPVFESALWTLDLNDAGARWTEAAPLPGPGRAFAAVTAQYDALCVFGGLVAGGDGVPAVSRDAWLFRLTPPEASLRSGWTRAADLARPAVGAVAFPVGPSAVVLAGGGEVAPVGLFPTAAELAGNRTPALYHTITNAWCDFNQPLTLKSMLAARQTTAIESRFLVVGDASGTGQAGLHEFRMVRNVRSLLLSLHRDDRHDRLATPEIERRLFARGSQCAVVGRRYQHVRHRRECDQLHGDPGSRVFHQPGFPVSDHHLCDGVFRAIPNDLSAFAADGNHLDLRIPRAPLQPDTAAHCQRAMHCVPDIRPRQRGACPALVGYLCNHRYQRVCERSADVGDHHGLHRGRWF